MLVVETIAKIRRAQSFLIGSVSVNIGLDFLSPEGFACPWPFEDMAVEGRVGLSLPCRRQARENP